MLNNLEIKLSSEHIAQLLRGMKLEQLFNNNNVNVRVTIIPENHGYFVKPDDFHQMTLMFDLKVIDQAVGLVKKIKNYNMTRE